MVWRSSASSSTSSMQELNMGMSHGNPSKTTPKGRPCPAILIMALLPPGGYPASEPPRLDNRNANYHSMLRRIVILDHFTTRFSASSVKSGMFIATGPSGRHQLRRRPWSDYTSPNRAMRIPSHDPESPKFHARSFPRQSKLSRSEPK